MKAVLLSIKPKYVELIASGKKTIEVRKTKPKIDTPFKCYIYCTYGNAKENYCLGKRGKVIGEFTCDFIVNGKESVRDWIYITENCGLSCSEIYDYCGTDKDGETNYCYGWHISNLKIYDKPKDLNEFTSICKFKDGNCDICVFYEKAIGGCCRTIKAPQSWCYVEEL